MTWVDVQLETISAAIINRKDRNIITPKIKQLKTINVENQKEASGSAILKRGQDSMIAVY